MPAKNQRFNRRRFLKTAAGAGAILMTPSFVPSSALGRDGLVAPSERIVMGGLGIGSRGGYDLGIFLEQPEVQFVAVADVRAERRTAVKQMVDAKYGNADCKTYWDMFEMLARDDIDACLIATGDRWHTQASIVTARAGKDMYCEKPCSLSIAESRGLADNIARYGRVYQAGTQRRNIANFILAIELAHSGRLGKLHTVHANTLDPATKKVWLEPQPEPAARRGQLGSLAGSRAVASLQRVLRARCVARVLRLPWRWHSGMGCTHGRSVPMGQPGGCDGPGGIRTAGATNVVARYANGVKLVMRDKGWMGLGTCAVRFDPERQRADAGRRERVPAGALHRVPAGPPVRGALSARRRGRRRGPAPR